MIDCILIDDEQFSVDALLKYIGMVPRLNLVGVYLNPQEAMEKIMQNNAVDLIFMDVDMPLISGLELSEVLRSKTKRLIFTTSHSKYAFEAFEVDADAFLLKPFTFARFSSTINRLFPLTSNAQETAHPSEHFLVKNKDEDLRIVNLRYTDVIAFESMQNYVRIHLIGNRQVVAYLTIQDILGLTKGHAYFVQFHRGFVISTHHISHIDGHRITMNEKVQFSVGETYKEVFNSFVSTRLLRTARLKKPSDVSTGKN